jgi:predicted nucleic acid-binding protein
MSMTHYVLDTNVVSDLLKHQQSVTNAVSLTLSRGDPLCVCLPVYFEILRGLLWKGATTQINTLNTTFLPIFDWISLIDEDWIQAAYFWKTSVSQGKQLADSDLLIAAIAFRLNATIVTADNDFDALPVQRENWRLEAK